MTPEAKSLTQVLLDHHRNVCLLATQPPDPDPYTIPYKTLCERAGVPGSHRVSAIFCKRLRSGATLKAGRQLIP